MKQRDFFSCTHTFIIIILFLIEKKGKILGKRVQVLCQVNGLKFAVCRIISNSSSLAKYMENVDSLATEIKSIASFFQTFGSANERQNTEHED